MMQKATVLAIEGHVDATISIVAGFFLKLIIFFHWFVGGVETSDPFFFEPLVKNTNTDQVRISKLT